jgi:hypothetical protein
MARYNRQIFLRNIRTGGAAVLAGALATGAVQPVFAGSASYPLSGIYVFNQTADCTSTAGGPTLFPVSTGNAALTPDTVHDYATFLKQNSVANPTNSTTYSSLGYVNGSGTVPEIQIQWGLGETLTITAEASEGAGAGNAVFDISASPFIVTRYPLPPGTSKTFSQGYLFYSYFPDSPVTAASWHQYKLVANHESFRANFASAVAFGPSRAFPYVCATRLDFHS